MQTFFVKTRGYRRNFSTLPSILLLTAIEQRGILSAHVQYKEAFISSRWNAPARGARASTSRSFWANQNKKY